ncbi:MAG: alpha/beta hydrolase family protein [Actinomycetota bacterium]
MPPRMRLAPLLLLLLLLGGCGMRFPDRRTATPLSAATQPLVEARRARPTRLFRRGPAPQDYDNQAPPGVERVTYGRRKLPAWLARPSGRGPHPAVLWAHGGFALAAADFEDARPFVAAGFVLMTPTWRGENGNPGDFELYCGEVDDACEALNYLAKRPDVDPKRIYVAGHSAGGTIAALTAESSRRVRAAAAVGALVDLRGAVERYRQPIFEEAPFQWSDPRENDLRSPARHLGDLRCPLALYFGAEESDLIEIARPMERYAKTLNKPVTLEIIPGADHATAVAPAVREMITHFRK